MSSMSNLSPPNNEKQWLINSEDLKLSLKRLQAETLQCFLISNVLLVFMGMFIYKNTQNFL